MGWPEIRTLSPDWRFTFGKHKGLTIREVVADYPSYFTWCYDSMDWFSNSVDKSKELLELLADAEANTELEKEEFYQGFDDDD